jgi:sterol desaturase/sphingolipid hydroxylase (fatty acid hydroxylase superfamily)
MVFVAVTEWIFPYHRRWLKSHHDVGLDIKYAIIIGLTGSLCQPLIAAIAIPTTAWLSAAFGQELWPHRWPLLIQVVLALVIAEFPKYWMHRLEHEWDLLWRIHATHHSVPRLYFLNAARFHPIDTAIDTVVGLLPLAILGCSAEVIALFVLVSAVHGYFQHANLQLRLGPLNYFFSMAELHRWHHSKTVEEANHNYGQNVIVWDLVFGTFFLPADREPPVEIGLANLPGFPKTLLAQLASPFRWRAIRESNSLV